MKQNASDNFHEEEYLECERWWVYGLLMRKQPIFSLWHYPQAVETGKRRTRESASRTLICYKRKAILVIKVYRNEV